MGDKKKVYDNVEEAGAVDTASASLSVEDNEEADNKAAVELLKKAMAELSQPFKYNGKEVTGIDLSGLLDLTAHDMVEIDAEMQRRGFTGHRIEMTRQYAMLLAAKINHMPYDFCDRMSARDSIRLKDAITVFLYAGQ
jgi:hypothetical protein